MIPTEKADAVARGLREAFGVDTCEAIAPVTGGHTSSPVFRIVVRGALLARVVRSL